MKKQSCWFLLFLTVFLGACSAGKAEKNDSGLDSDALVERPAFDSDSAYFYVESQVAFGPRVPNTEAHRKAGEWISAKMEEFGWEVRDQPARITAFDGTQLQARNIFARLNPDSPDRILLLAHWDSRPWADADPDPANREKPVLGANDGASGVGVLMEIARQLKVAGSKAPVDILFVDAEDWGSHDDEDSWALGTTYFIENPPVPSYRPAYAVLLDMVGSPNATFGLEYFSRHAAPALQNKVWSRAAALGHGNYFKSAFGGMVTDDHVKLIEHGIPAIDIIDYRNSNGYQGFDPVWHTTRDDMNNISRETLQAVGETVMSILTEN